MASYGGNPGPSSDMYSDAGEMGESQSAPESGEHDEGEGETTVVSKSICPGMEFKPGEEMVLKVKRVLDDSYEMVYAPEPKGGDKGGKGSEPAGMAEGGGGGAMSSMYD